MGYINLADVTYKKNKKQKTTSLGLASASEDKERFLRMTNSALKTKPVLSQIKLTQAN